MARQRKGTLERGTVPRKSLDHVRVDRLGRVVRKTVVDGHEREAVSAWVVRPMRRGRGRPPGRRLRLTIEKILSWADDHRRRTGDWPTRKSGRVLAAFGERWSAIDEALTRGFRGLSRGSSLASLLHERRGYRHPHKLPPLRKGQILAWADAFHERRGRWPTHLDGPIYDAPGETWLGVDSALSQGHRGLIGGDTLRGLLHERRGVPHHLRQPKYTTGQILCWADAHHRGSGRWPTSSSGAIPSAPTETWARVDGALKAGVRGLRGKSSLAKLLAKRRGARNPARLPRLSVRQILRWADDHRQRSGRWPSPDSGTIPRSGGETWYALEDALRKGTRGLSPGGSVARLLQRARAVRNIHGLPQLSVPQILAWADAHRGQTGRWPRGDAGAVRNANGETWASIDHSLRRGSRGLPGGFGLAGLLERHRGVRNVQHLPKLTIAQILAWADAHRGRNGVWPLKNSGLIPESSGDSWANVDQALRNGGRGLKAGSSLAQLLASRRGHRNRKALPRLTTTEIVRWARLHRQRAGDWPKARSGPVADAPGETWSAIANALGKGGRGLPGGETLGRLLDRGGGGEMPGM